MNSIILQIQFLVNESQNLFIMFSLDLQKCSLTDHYIDAFCSEVNLVRLYRTIKEQQLSIHLLHVLPTDTRNSVNLQFSNVLKVNLNIFLVFEFFQNLCIYEGKTRQLSKCFHICLYTLNLFKQTVFVLFLELNPSY